MKKSKVLLIVIVILIVTSVVLVLGYKRIGSNSTNKKSIDNGVKINGFEYVLYDSQPKLYKDEFNKLKNNLESDNIDYEEYARSVAKMFLIDLYNLDYKKNMYDVGGVAFVYPDARENYKLNVTNTLYKYIVDNSDKKRDQELPRVKNVSIINNETTEYNIDGSLFSGYKYDLKIDYEEDLGYDELCEVIIIRVDKYLYVVEKNNIDE